MVVLGLHGGRGKNPVSVQTQKTLWILRQISQRQNQVFLPRDKDNSKNGPIGITQDLRSVPTRPRNRSKASYTLCILFFPEKIINQTCIDFCPFGRIENDFVNRNLAKAFRRPWRELFPGFKSGFVNFARQCVDLISRGIFVSNFIKPAIEQELQVSMIEYDHPGYIVKLSVCNPCHLTHALLPR
jgi:hypothetical protein